jgi:hypothetical protein
MFGAMFRTARFENVMIVVDTGTVVTFFLTCVMDLFLAVTMLVFSSRRFSLCGNRRVLTFPSGFVGKIDLELLVSLFGSGLHFAVPIC